MALMKILRGNEENLSKQELHDGYIWYVKTNSTMYIDHYNDSGTLVRSQLSAEFADKLRYIKDGETIEITPEQIVKFTDLTWSNIQGKPETYTPSAHSHDDVYYTESEVDKLLGEKASVTDYNESIIGLSVDGRTVTYIKGDGSVHSFTTQDTDTTYSLATDETTGLVKLYATTGSAEDGTMTQKAIKTELDKKVGVTIDDASNTLIFTI